MRDEKEIRTLIQEYLLAFEDEVLPSRDYQKLKREDKFINLSGADFGFHTLRSKVKS